MLPEGAAPVDGRISYFLHILSATLFLSFLSRFFLFPRAFPPSPLRSTHPLGFRVATEKVRGNEREVADLNSTYYSRRRLSDIFALFFARGEIRRVIVYN